MDRPGKAGVWSKEAVDYVRKIPREEIKTIKHMSKIELVCYLHEVWQRGYDAGRAAVQNEHGAKDGEAEKGASPDGNV